MMVLADDGAALALRVSPREPRTTFGESVELDVEVHSRNSAVWIPNFLEVGSNLQVLILGPDGRRIRHVAPHYSYEPFERETFLKLMPEHYLGRRISVSARHFADPGKYELQVDYHGADDGSHARISAWVGAVRSNVVVVSVEN